MTYLSNAPAAQVAAAQSTLFLPIPGHPNYEISLSGQVRNRSNNRVLAIYPRKAGPRRFYHHCRIGYVHRLLMTVVCGRPLTRSEHVRHLDNDTFNNRISNLAVGDAKANAADRLAHGTYGTVLTAGHVREIRRLAATWARKRIAHVFNISLSHVGNILTGRCWANLL